MNFFQLIKQVLDDLYADIPGTESEKDALIRDAMAYMRKWYRTMLTPELRSADCIDYSDPVVRFAYIYKYTTAHASYVHQCIEQCPDLSQLFEKDRLTASCIGGGPGSDFLGILKYMIRRSKGTALTCFLYDREVAWGESWGDIGAKLSDTHFRIFPNFQRMDIAIPAEWQSLTKYLKSDLVTISYFMSEIIHEVDRCQRFLEHLFRNAQDGTLFLFLDNNLDDVFGWFDDLAKSNDVFHLYEYEGEMIISSDEQKDDLEPYLSKFDYPKLRANIAYRVSRKIELPF